MKLMALSLLTVMTPAYSLVIRTPAAGTLARSAGRRPLPPSSFRRGSPTMVESSSFGTSTSGPSGTTSGLGSGRDPDKLLSEGQNLLSDAVKVRA